MREIKFRVWDEKHKDFVKSPILVRNDGLIFSEYVGGGTPQKNLILMQYTGLKDKKGKEIYEGDQIRCDGHSWEEKFDAIVEFGRCQFRESRMNTNLSDIVSIEVIGNIYENPNLFK
jgi:uncharacterized phage protein (TIGR01671 family)